jgi:ATP-dependent RNA helicase RhlE
VAEDYVHRIGRTARAEASGRASSFAAPDEHDLLRGIEKLTRRPVERAKVPRESATFRSAVERHAATQAQRPHRPARPHNPSRHPPRAPAPAHAPPPQGKSLGTWKPRRRR